MSLDIEPIKSRSYTAEQVDRALLVLAISGGNSERAHDELKAQGDEIPTSTLKAWRTIQYPQRYNHIREQQGRRLEDFLVQQQREIALKASEVTLEALEHTSADLKAGKVREPARTAQASATVAGISVTKVLELTGRPTVTVQHFNANQVLAKYGGHVIEGNAEELTSEPSATREQLMTGSDSGNAHE